MRTKSLPFTLRQRVALRCGAVALLLLVVHFSSGCNSLFYFPDRVEYHQPLEAGQVAEEVYFTADDGVVLHGRFIPATVHPAKGTVIHFHGNAQNLTSHYWFVNWLPATGYNVFQFDYRGYGKSGLWRIPPPKDGQLTQPGGGMALAMGPGGRPLPEAAACDLPPDREGVFWDCVAALNYVSRRADVDQSRLIGFGQSLGGCAMLAAVAETDPTRLCGVVVESSFRSYREMARRKAAQSWLLWPFQYPLSWLLISEAHSPADAMDRLQNLPLLAIYGLDDSVVPGDQTQALYDQWPGPKQLATVPNANHLQARERVGDPAYIQLIDTFMQDCLRRKPAMPAAAARATLE